MLNVIIKSKFSETPDIVSFELAAANDAELPKFDAGAHIDVHIDEQTVRQYSLLNHPDEKNTYRIAVLRDANSRGGSIKIHEHFKVGDNVKISTPRNLFPLKTDSNRTLLFAGGIGVTPLLSMAHVLHHLGRDFELHYYARSEEHCAFYEALRSSPFNARVFFHFEGARSGTPAEAARALSQPGPETHLYTCGPTGFMDCIFDTAKAQGWSESNLHKEVFKAEPVEHSGDDRPFEMKLTRSGKRLHVPADKTALEVLDEAGIEVEASCEQGICGACLTRVTDGVPEHRDQFMTDSEKSRNDQFTPCCSRALSDSLSIEL